MQRKATKNTRAANSEEKAFHKWLKHHSCCYCGNESPSIVDHARGATFKHNKVLIGHWFCLPVCVTCDTEKTIHGKRLGNESETWFSLAVDYTIETGIYPPLDVIQAIQDWNR